MLLEEIRGKRSQTAKVIRNDTHFCKTANLTWKTFTAKRSIILPDILKTLCQESSKIQAHRQRLVQQNTWGLYKTGKDWQLCNSNMKFCFLSFSINCLKRTLTEWKVIFRSGQPNTGRTMLFHHLQTLLISFKIFQV